MKSRILVLAAALVSLAACTSDTENSNAAAEPTSPEAPRASVSAAPVMAVIDTTEASSVCKAVVRQRGVAIAKLDTETVSADERAQATALDAMAADVCQ